MAAKRQIKPISTKFDPESNDYIQGHLQPIAARVLMKILYGARMARFDLLRAVCYLATFITKWDAMCYKRLRPLMCYINSTLDLCMVGWIGDPISKISPRLYADADFAGDHTSSRSTSGIFLILYGDDTRFPLTGSSGRQGAVSHSTTEAEAIAADTAVRTIGIPSLELWEILLKRTDLKITFHEDNQAMIKIIQTGKNPQLRHIGRTHRVSIAWLHETFKHDWLDLVYQDTYGQAADIFTKAFTEAEK